jgi:excisionase family DNA binding protein
MERATYTLKEACTILGLSRFTVLKMVDEGRLDAIKFPRKILITKFSLDKLLNVQPASANHITSK